MNGPECSYKHYGSKITIQDCGGVIKKPVNLWTCCEECVGEDSVEGSPYGRDITAGEIPMDESIRGITHLAGQF